MSEKGDRPSDRFLQPLRPARSTEEAIAAIIPWRLVQPEAGESCRWECVDGRWVAVSLGQGADLGTVVVADSTGQRRTVDSYEGALEVAKSLRTWDMA